MHPTPSVLQRSKNHPRYSAGNRLEKEGILVRVRRRSLFEGWDARNEAAIQREAETYRIEVAKREEALARHSEARRRRADRVIEVDGRRLRVKIRPRFQPSREAPTNLELWRGLFWSLPAMGLRRLVDPQGWTVLVYELNRWPKPRGERLLLKEHLDNEDAAVARADDLASSLASGSLRLP